MVCFQQCVWVWVFVCQHDNFWTVRDNIMKYFNMFLAILHYLCVAIAVGNWLCLLQAAALCFCQPRHLWSRLTTFVRRRWNVWCRLTWLTWATAPTSSAIQAFWLVHFFLRRIILSHFSVVVRCCVRWNNKTTWLLFMFTCNAVDFLLNGVRQFSSFNEFLCYVSRSKFAEMCGRLCLWILIGFFGQSLVH